MPVAIRPILAVDFTMTALVTENVDHVALRPFYVTKAHVNCIAADANSTTQLSRGVGGVFNVITDAMISAVASVYVPCAQIINAQATVAPGQTLRCIFTATNSTLNARATAFILPTAIQGA